MIRPAKHTRIPNLPFLESLSGARLRAIRDETRGAGRQFIVDYDSLRLAKPAEIFCEDGRVYERVKGAYLPQRLRFTGVHSVLRDGVFTDLHALSIDHPARSVRGVLSWIIRGDTDLFSLFSHGSDDPARLWIKSQGCVNEDREGTPEAVEMVRDWSPPPPFRPGLVRELKQLQQRFGGDPVTVRMGGQTFHQRLFVGGIEYQTERRPQVDAVLNVGEEQSVWVQSSETQPADRFVTRGEGSRGMTVEQLTEEADWVIERLRKGQRVLVHCVAGLNRSITVCCAALILLEGLTAGAALDRVRDRHAWARPDDHHWLILKWLAKSQGV